MHVDILKFQARIEIWEDLMQVLAEKSIIQVGFFIRKISFQVSCYEKTFLKSATIPKSLLIDQIDASAGT